MNTDAFRHLYSYHFAANRKIWDEYVMPLTQEKFVQKTDYSVGSVRNQIVHLMSVDDRWFSGLRGEEIPPFLNPVHFVKKDKIRAHWDIVEQNMQIYLDQLRDDMLFTHPLEGKNEVMPLWQVLIHVVNHATDHRAQMLALLNSLGVQTSSQDYFFHIMGNL